jgi:hypothetical protein
MRPSATRKTGKIVTVATLATIVLLGASASAATLTSGIVHIQLGSSFPDPATWALMLVSFGLIGAGVRSRKRSVVLA